jgi:cyanophycinase
MFMTGMLMPIGGAEDRHAQQTILKHFVQICGGRGARIALIPSASRISNEVAADYESIFFNLGAIRVQTVDISHRQQANERQCTELLSDITGIFFTGGDQLRLLSLIGNTHFADAINSHFNRGVHIAGTSAGASAMSHHMIGFGKSGSLPSPHMVHMSSGLGLARSLIIDQHFSQRNRIGRLMSAVTLHPNMLGIGLDEDTSLTIASSGKCRVVGSGTVTLVMDTHINQIRQFTNYNTQVAVSDKLAVSQLKAGDEVLLPHLS